jgi:hypothetical protein
VHREEAAARRAGGDPVVCFGASGCDPALRRRRITTIAHATPPATAAPISAHAQPGRPFDSSKDFEALFAAAAAPTAAGAWLVVVVVVVEGAVAVSVLITVFVCAGAVTVVVVAGAVVVLVWVCVTVFAGGGELVVVVEVEAAVAVADLVCEDVLAV